MPCLPAGMAKSIMKDKFNQTVGFSSPLSSCSTRPIPKRSTKSSRGGVVVQLPSQTNPRVILFESKLEQRVLYLLLARKSVWDIREQPEPFKYLGRDGRRKYHFFDFLVTLTSGRIVAVAVKPMKLVVKHRFLLDLEDIRSAMTREFADDVVLITDQDFTKAAALNAERFHAFARCQNENLQKRLEDLACSVTFPQTVEALQKRLGAGADGFRAIFLAIFDGVLSADKTKEIGLKTVVRLGELS